jgi:hypothetical protein
VVEEAWLRDPPAAPHPLVVEEAVQRVPPAASLRAEVKVEPVAACSRAQQPVAACSRAQQASPRCLTPLSLLAGPLALAGEEGRRRIQDIVRGLEEDGTANFSMM